MSATCLHKETPQNTLDSEAWVNFLVSDTYQCTRMAHPEDTKASSWAFPYVSLHLAALGKACIYAKSFQSCLTLCEPKDYSLPGSSVLGIFQARILDRIDLHSSRVYSQPRDQTHLSYVSCIGRQVLYH